MTVQQQVDGQEAGVLAEIGARLAAITPEKFIQPKKMLEDEPDGAYTRVCPASNDIKRLWTLMKMISDELKVDAKHLDTLMNDLVKDVKKGGGGVVGMLKNLVGGGVSPEAIAEAERAGNAFRLKEQLFNVVRDIFWLEVRRFVPELANKDTIGIFADWSLAWRDEPEEKKEKKRKLMIDVLGNELPPELREALREQFEARMP